MARIPLLILLLGVGLSGCHHDPLETPEPAPAASAPAETAAPVQQPPATHEHATDADGPPEEPHPYDEHADARAEIDAAVAASRQDQKPVLLVFGANWCPWCRRLDYLMRHDARVEASLEARFHLVHVNVGERESNTNREIDQAYGHPTQNGLPVMVVLNAQGEVVHTQETGALEEGDHHDPEKVLRFLERFGAGSTRGASPT